MASSEPVEVAVEILDGFSDELAELEAKLEKIDGKRLSVDLDIDGLEIEEIKTRLKELERNLNTNLDIDVQDYLRAKAMKQDLARDMSSTLDIDTGRAHLRNLSGGNGFGPPGVPNRRKSSGIQPVVPHVDLRTIKRLAPGDGRSGTVAAFDNPIDGFGKQMRALVPSMHRWHQVIAAIIPVLVTLAGAALGAISALLAVGAAGAAMAGIGALGFGDTAGESIENLKKELADTGKEIVGILQPVANAFQPFVQGALDKAPGLVQSLVDPLQRLEEVGFDTFWLEALEGVTGWIGDLVNAFADLAPQIQVLSWGIGKLFGDILIGLLRWSIKELYANWEAFMRLGQTVGDLILILYGLSKAVTFALSVFRPVTQLAAWLADIFSNRFMAALLAATVAVVGMHYALVAVYGVMAAIKGLAIAQAFYAAIAGIGSLTAAAGVLWGALQAVVASLFTIHGLTGGILLGAAGLIGAGVVMDEFSKPQTPGGGSPAYNPGAANAGGRGGGTTINVYGDVRRKEYQKLQDEFPGLYEEQATIESETNR